MKKVLIITEVFPPAFNPRMGYLVRFLPEFGWDADIITQNSIKENNFRFLVGNNKIIKVKPKHTGVPSGIVQKLWYLLSLRKHFKNNRLPFLRGIKQNFKRDDYSVILVSVAWWSLYVLDAALIISGRWRIPLIVDLRDIDEQKPVRVITCSRNFKDLLLCCLQKSFKRSKIRSRNRVLENADAVSTVSPFHVEELKKYNKNIKLIYNGFDPDLFFPESTGKMSVFSIIYTGLVFEYEQDPGLLFEAVIQLDKNGIITSDSFRIQFYTPAGYRTAILNDPHFTLVESYIDFFDYVDYSEVPELLQRSSIALVLTNLSTENGPKGVLTTKFFEYLGAERPVLCVRSDESILEGFIKRSNIGVAARNAGEAYDFILEKWNEWTQNGYTRVNVNQQFKMQFSRKTQAKQFANLFEEVSKNM